MIPGTAPIGLCTDSNSQLPPDLVARYGVEVVPLTVTVDGQAFLENQDMDAEQFWARFEVGVTQVSTAAPSPGQFAAAYRALAERGATEILSVHIGARVSATLGAARLAAAAAPVPVRLVDTGTASFGVACCLWEAAEAIAAGSGLEQAAQVAEGVSRRLGNVFVLRAPDLARRGGRLAAAARPPAQVPVLSLVEGRMVEVGRVETLEAAAQAMAAHVLAAAPPAKAPPAKAPPAARLRVGVGVADSGAAPLWLALEAILAAAPEVAEVVRYRMGPSVGAHTGPGSAGAFFYPLG